MDEEERVKQKIFREAVMSQPHYNYNNTKAIYGENINIHNQIFQAQKKEQSYTEEERGRNNDNDHNQNKQQGR